MHPLDEAASAARKKATSLRTLADATEAVAHSLRALAGGEELAAAELAGDARNALPVVAPVFTDVRSGKRPKPPAPAPLPAAPAPSLAAVGGTDAAGEPLHNLLANTTWVHTLASWSVRAVPGDATAAVEFALLRPDGSPALRILENYGPYYLFGDVGGKPNPPPAALPRGAYTLRITPWRLTGGSATSGNVAGLPRTFTVRWDAVAPPPPEPEPPLPPAPEPPAPQPDPAAPSVASLAGTDAAGNPVADLASGTWTHSLAAWSARATPGAGTAALEFQLLRPDGSVALRVLENYAPYYLFGDVAGKPNPPPATLPRGTYGLRVTPWKLTGGAATAGNVAGPARHYTVAWSATAPPPPDPTPDPEPVPDPPPPAPDLPSLNALPGRPLFFRAPAAVLSAPKPEENPVAWDFGNGRKMDGFVSCVIYEAPGTYTVSFNGTPAYRVTVHPPPPTVYVANYAELVSALLKATPSDIVVTAALHIGQTVNVCGASHVVRAATPGLRLTGTSGGTMFSPPMRGPGLVIRDFAVDTAGERPISSKASGALLLSAGSLCAVVGCTFGFMRDVCVGNRGTAEGQLGYPLNVALLGNRLPGPGDLMNYFAWAEGQGWVICDNYVANSVWEHCVRAGSSNNASPGCNYLTLQGNDMTNLDRRAEGDTRDVAKGTANIQKGSYACIDSNTFSPYAGIGPLGGGDGVGDTAARWRIARITRNTVKPSRTTPDAAFYLEHGVEKVYTAGNTFRRLVAEVWAEGDDALYARGVREWTSVGDTLTGPAGTILLNVLGKAPTPAGPYIRGLRIAYNAEPAAQYVMPPIVYNSGWLSAYRLEGITLPGNLLKMWPGGLPHAARMGGQNDTAAYLTADKLAALPGVTGVAVGTAVIEAPPPL
jgi:hypothetical protein